MQPQSLTSAIRHDWEKHSVNGIKSQKRKETELRHELN